MTEPRQIAVVRNYDDKDYIVQLRVKNGPLLRAMRHAGFSREKLAELSDVAPGTISRFLNLQIAPIGKRGRWSESALKMARVLGLPPDALFPAQHLEHCLRRNTGEFEVSAEEIATLLAPPRVATPEKLLVRAETASKIRSAMSTLNPRYARVLSLRFGFEGDEQTLDQIAENFGCGKERIRQIEAKAMRLLRHPKRRLRRTDLEAFAVEEVE